jgi:acyl-CoA synthetase (AMP-forming)/AMP-acid ligase II
MTAPTLRAALDRLAASTGSLVLGVPPDDAWLGYPQLLRQAVRVAGSLYRQGVRPHDRVVMRIGTSLPDVTVLLGIVYLGAVVVSVKPTVPGVDETAYLAEVARQQRARYAYGLNHPDLVTVRPDWPGADPTPTCPDVATPDDVAFVQYTSGSTGLPRPVPLTHRALLADIQGINSIARCGQHRAGLVVVPLHHDMGLVGMLAGLVDQIDLYLVETSAFLRRPLRCLELAAALRVTATAMPDFLMRFLANRLRDGAAHSAELFRSWDTIYCGAEPIRRRTVRELLAVAKPLGLDSTALVFCYGLAEAALLVSAHRYVDAARSFDYDDPARPACLGRPIEGMEIQIRGVDGGVARDRELGAVWLRGTSMFSGYDNRTDHRTVWFETGDLGYLRGGDLYLSGRRTDLVVVNGGNLFVSDIEAHLLRREDVADCVALPDEDGFSVFVVPRPGAHFDPVCIAAAVVAEFAVAPASVQRITRPDIVRTASGKPARGIMVDHLVKGAVT